MSQGGVAQGSAASSGVVSEHSALAVTGRPYALCQACDMWLRGPIQLSDHLKTKYHKRKRNNNPHLAADDVILKGDMWDEFFFPCERPLVPRRSVAWHGTRRPSRGTRNLPCSVVVLQRPSLLPSQQTFPKQPPRRPRCCSPHRKISRLGQSLGKKRSDFMPSHGLFFLPA